MTKNTGGAAFARAQSRDPEDYSAPEVYPAQEGMTLRDYFAAKAMQAFIERAANGTEFGVSHAGNNSNYAKAAYAFADAMLAARGAA